MQNGSIKTKTSPIDYHCCLFIRKMNWDFYYCTGKSPIFFKFFCNLFTRYFWKNEGIKYSVFGDIFLEDLRKYRESRLSEIGMKAIFPLWHKDTRALISEFINLNYKTIIVCTQHNLKDLCGKIITEDLIDQLPPEIDPCGENGEFHTFAFEGPIFKAKVDFSVGEQVFRTYNSPAKTTSVDNDSCAKPALSGFWYVDLVD